jgi:hypothetical protein
MAEHLTAASAAGGTTSNGPASGNGSAPGGVADDVIDVEFEEKK